MALALGLMASAQVKIGNNPTAIDANSLLELEATNQGLLYPRVALVSTDSYSPLVAVNPLTSLVEKQKGMTVYNTATTTTGTNDVTPGLYVNDGTNWVKITPKTLYSDNGALNSARTVTQNNNNLTFTTGTAKTIVDGNFQTKSIYGKVVNTGTAASYTVLSDDYIIVTQNTTAVAISLPDATTNAGRIIIIVNNNSAGTVTPSATSQYAFAMTLAIGRGKHYISDGVKWCAVSFN